MVLHKSKWDRKATYQYLKKHGLQPQKEHVVRPKWSGKKSQEPKRVLYDDSDSEWDEEDDALINHFYPQIGEQTLSVEQKLKIKRQIIQGLMQKSEQPEAGEEEEQEEDEMGGIYLGTPDNDKLEEEEFALPDLETKLSDFVIADLGKNRKLLRQKVSDNLLEEYGIASYASTVKDTNYNTPAEIKIDKLTADDLHGFRIGDTLKPKQETIRTLTEDEQNEHSERAQKLERERLYSQIKNTFGDQKSQKVLEINNFNSNDKRLMDVLNLKIIKQSEAKSGDLDDLLGFTDEPATLQAQDLDLLLELAKGDAKEEKRELVFVGRAPRRDEDFLDDLLG